MVDLIQASFAKGEVSPALYGRTDTSAYQIGLRKAKNMIVHPRGGISNRAGTILLGPAKQHNAPPRLIDFEFNTSDKYMLEFGDLYMRVIRNDGHVLEPVQVITNISQGDPAIVTIVGHGLSDGDEVFIADVVGMTEVNGKRFTISDITTDTFSLKKQTTGTNISSLGFTAYSSAGTTGRVFTLATPYLQAELADLNVVQSADVMTIVHVNHPVKDLTRSDHHVWTLTDATFTPQIAAPTGLSVTATTTGSNTDSYTVTAIDAASGEESLAALNTNTATITDATSANPVVITATAHGFTDGQDVEINSLTGLTELNGRRFRVANKSTNTFELNNDGGFLEDGSTYGTYISGGTANLTFFTITDSREPEHNTISWLTVDGAVRYNVYKSNGGDSLFGFIGQTTGLSFTEGGAASTTPGIAPDTSISPPLQRNPFRVAGEFPGAVSFFEQRRVFGGSILEPDTTRYSQTGNIDNLSSSSPPQADDAITATLNSRQVNQIRHFVPGNDLIVFTSGSEWRINSGGASGFSPDSITQKPQSEWGIGKLRPIVAGTTIMFVPDNGTAVRSLSFSLQQDAYTGSDLSILSNHFLEEFVLSDWAYQRLPESRVYMVRTDGSMLTMTFNADQQVVAWTIWDTKGKFESVASLRHEPTETEDGIYVVSRRDIDGEVVRFIEKLHTRFFNDPADAFFLDAGQSLDNPLPITNVTPGTPVVVEVIAHTFSVGDEVDIDGIEWETIIAENGEEIDPDSLNGGRFIVLATTTNTISLADDETAGFDLNSITFENTSIVGVSPIVIARFSFLSSDGTKMYTGDSGSGRNRFINEYDLSTPFNVSTAVSSGNVLDLDSEINPNVPSDIFFRADGEKLFVLSNTNRKIFQYSLSTAWDLSTATFDDISSPNLVTLIAGTDSENFGGMSIKPDGTRLFLTESFNDFVFEFDLGVFNDLSTLTYSGVSFSPSGNTVSLSVGGCIDGTRMFILRSDTDRIEQYSLSTAWDLSTASSDSISFSINSEEGFPNQIHINNDGLNLYLIGTQRDKVFQYSMEGGLCPTTLEQTITFSIDGVLFTGNLNFLTGVSDGEARLVVDGVSGLDALEGEDVVVLFDGHTHTATVGGGSIALPSGASRVHVGLAYISEIETLDPVSPGQGTVQAREMNASKAVIKFEKSRGLLIGPDKDNLTEMKQRQFEKYGEPTRLLTGEHEQHLIRQWNNNGRLLLRQKDPLPMTILSIVPDYDAGDA